MNEEGSLSVQQQSQKLFKSIISEHQLQHLSVTWNRQQFLELCRGVGTLFFRKVNKKPNQVLAFLNNYHQIILAIHKNHSNQNQQKQNRIKDDINLFGAFVNNISLHFILLASYNLLETGQESEAKQLLKNSVNYVDTIGPDPILLSTALSNLSLIMMRRQKYYKPLPYLLKTAQILQTHIKQIKKSNLSPQQKQFEIVEVIIFLVNNYINLSKCLQKIIYKSNRQSYKTMLRNVNNVAIKKSLKYLGKSSFFTNKLISQIQYQTASNVYHVGLPLPVYKPVIEQQRNQYEEQQEDQREKKIMQQFDKLYALIKQIQEKQKAVNIIEREKPPHPPPFVRSSEEVVCKVSFKVNDWDVQVEIMKEKKKEKIGTTVLNCYRGKQHINLLIQEKKMLRILTQMNLYDLIPYQISIETMTAEEFIQYGIIGFLFIDDNKNLELYPRSVGITNPILFKIMNKECYIFLNHIRQNTYRLAICPISESSTFHLDLELSAKTMEELFELEEPINPYLIKIYEMLSKNNPSKKDASSSSRMRSSMANQPKSLSVKDEDSLILLIKRILQNFSNFLMEKKIEEEISVFQSEFEYYKFKQDEKNGYEGRFYFIRYFQKSQLIQVYAQNTYKTYGIQGKSKAKGNARVKLHNVSLDMGFIQANLQVQFKETPFTPFKMLAEMFSQKYELKSYENPLSMTDLETYQENSMVEMNFTFKTFLRKMVKYQDYYSPVTITLITINNQLPIGIKVSLYDQIICQEAGYFIQIYPSEWKWPTEISHLKNEYEDILYNVVEQYQYKKDYFLVEWLERIGYRKIFDQIKISSEGDLEIKGLNPTFDRMSSLLNFVYK